MSLEAKIRLRDDKAFWFVIAIFILGIIAMSVHAIYELFVKGTPNA